jgi:hypothetical protein
MKLKPHADCAVCRYWLARAEEDRSHSLKSKAKKELAEHLARTANLPQSVPGGKPNEAVKDFIFEKREHDDKAEF